MTVDFAYDPVTAMDEATATGETAVLFAEIRQTMRIPLVTSIWRGLAGMDDSLRLAWAAAKPIYESGEPERALTRSVAAVGLPRPEPLAPTALACMGLTEDQWTVSLRSRMIVCERPVLGPFGDRLGRHRHRLVRASEQHEGVHRVVVGVGADGDACDPGPGEEGGWSRCHFSRCSPERRIPQMVRARCNSPALALETMPWK